MKEEGIYIHVPYCRGKCLYCDFFSGGMASADFSRYAKSIIGELRERRLELKSTPSTLYIGGGTPSILDGDALSYMIGNVRSITGKSDEWEEFTIEVNPEDVDEERCRMWRNNGVTRVSMGIQSLNDDELRRIGRRHDSRRALDAMEMLKRYFGNVSVDLIFGLPGQTVESWRRSVEGVLAKRPQHISGYSLMFEPGTPMSVLREQGRLTFPDEDECVAMWQTLAELIKGAGYEQYELSNYALPGSESVHNRRYWLGNPYLGLGPSAHSFDGERTRRANPNRIKEYIRRFGEVDPESKENEVKKRSEPPFYEEEILGKEELKEEMIMLAMRMRRGLDTELFRERFGEKAYLRLMRNFRKESSNGLAEMSGKFIKLTDAGIMVADEVIVNLSM